MDLVKYVFTIPGVNVFLSNRLCQDPKEGELMRIPQSNNLWKIQELCGLLTVYVDKLEETVEGPH